MMSETVASKINGVASGVQWLVESWIAALSSTASWRVPAAMAPGGELLLQGFEEIGP